ncbi:hypothetical protein RRSWK_00164 [Rhodopirellula sp. SWK7]|nr:hypothetical protein RRSWK_00164 [Rhodopirellula sp. SWK7]
MHFCLRSQNRLARYDAVSVRTPNSITVSTVASDRPHSLGSQSAPIILVKCIDFGSQESARREIFSGHRPALSRIIMRTSANPA